MFQAVVPQCPEIPRGCGTGGGRKLASPRLVHTRPARDVHSDLLVLASYAICDLMYYAGDLGWLASASHARGGAISFRAAQCFLLPGAAINMHQNKTLASIRK